jgi:hypothetical protein
MRTRIVFVVVSALLLTGLTAPSEAAGFHAYSIAQELSAAGQYTGVRNTREDVSITTTDFVFQTMWVIISGGGWEELGTEHQTNGARSWYWGWGGVSGAWYELGRRSGRPTGTHTFSLYRTGGSTWHYLIDSTQMGTDTWTAAGARLDIGLESYDAGAIVNKYTHRSISRTINEGAWTLWTGFDGKSVNTGMCGGWDYSYQWRASENRAC